MLSCLTKCHYSVEKSYSDDCLRVYNTEALNHFDPELQLINTEPIMEITLKDLLGELNC